MAHTAQQRKRIRQDNARQLHNTKQKSAIRTAVKAFEKSVTSDDRASIAAAFKSAMSALAQGVRKGLVTKNAAARKTSRMAARINAAK
ncbi:MAG: 30S ribosomal protein S20 [Pseudomonadaceae bacterium]|nr:30S ribosomal protein S20 [Pseudomonadaceae bacterium]